MLIDSIFASAIQMLRNQYFPKVGCCLQVCKYFPSFCSNGNGPLFLKSFLSLFCSIPGIANIPIRSQITLNRSRYHLHIISYLLLVDDVTIRIFLNRQLSLRDASHKTSPQTKRHLSSLDTFHL